MRNVVLIFIINLALSQAAIASTPSPQNGLGSAPEIVIQQGMAGRPSHIAVSHHQGASFMEVFHEDGEQVWRKSKDDGAWRVFRQWSYRSRSCSHYRDGKEVYQSIIHGGMLELYNADDWSQVFRAKLPYKVDACPQVYFGPHGSYRIIKVPTYDTNGSKVARLWISHGGSGWKPVNNIPTLKGFWEIRSGFFDGKDISGEYRFYRVGDRGLVQVDELRGSWKRIHAVLSLGKQTFAIGEKVEGLAKIFDAYDKGMRWKLYSWHAGKGWRSVEGRIGRPESIREFTRLGNGYFSVQMRGVQPLEPLNADRIFHERAGGGLERLSAMKIGGPMKLGEFVVLASGSVIGMREHDDQDQDGRIGSWRWRLRTPKGWVDLSQLLPRTEVNILRVVDWFGGNGLGMEVADTDGQTAWYWFLRREGGAWQPLFQKIPALAGMEITRIVELRDGLYGFVDDDKQVQSPQVGSRISIFASKVRWYVHAEDGSWQAVDDLLRQVNHSDYVGHIASIDARSNALMLHVEMEPGSPLFNLILYRQRDGVWRELDSTFYLDDTIRTDMRLLSRARATVDADAGVVLLKRVLPKAWYAVQTSATQQVLYRKSGQWYLMPDTQHDASAPLVYDRSRQLLIRKSDVPEERYWFLLDDRKGWVELRKILPDAPKEIVSAYAFLNRRGVAIQEYRDSNKDGKFFQWLYYQKVGDGWQPLKRGLSGISGDIGAVIDIGKRTVALEGEGRWHYFSVTGNGAWFNINDSLPGLPEHLDSVHVSRDGRVLIAKEAWDSNKNGVSWEGIVAVRKRLSDPFTMIGKVLTDSEKLAIVDAKSLWNGSGVAIEIAKEGEKVQTGSRFVEHSRWKFYLWRQGKLGPAQGLPKAARFRANGDGTKIALLDMRGHWRLFGRKSGGNVFHELALPGKQHIQNVVFDKITDYLGVKQSDLFLDGKESWQWWDLGAEGVVGPSLGNTGKPFWWPFAGVEKQGGRTQFETRLHSVDGMVGEDVPTPEVWIHADSKLGDKGNLIYAPGILNRFLHLGSIASGVKIEALGIGPEGHVILYRYGDRRFATAFSNGYTHIEARPLYIPKQGGGYRKQSVTLLVNKSRNGLLRLVRMDQPDHWLWGYGAKDGMIYFDEAGHFYSDSETLSQKVVFRKDNELFSITQFGSLLFRPDVLEQRLGVPKGSMFELTHRDKERMQRAVSLAHQGLSLKNSTPPRLTISDVPEETDKPYIEIGLKAEGNGVGEGSIVADILGAGHVRGEAVQGIEGRKQKSVRLIKKIPLVRGLNRIKLSVVDADGLEAWKYVNVDYRPKGNHKPRLWAAVIATKDYMSPDFAQLPLTQNDAKVIRSLLKRQQSKMFDQVVVKSWCQSEQCDSQPVKRLIAKELPLFLSQAKNGDRIEIFVSGHGVKLDDEFYIVPSDGKIEDKQSLISWSEVQSWLQSSPLGKKLVFLDTCQSGSVFGSKRNKRRLFQEAVEDGGVYVLAATAENASAYELNDVGDGLFTYAVKEGMNGMADSNSDGWISFQDLSFFLARRVRELSKAFDVPMEPEVPIVNEEMDFIVTGAERKLRLYLNVGDEASFDMSATPGRVRFWKKQLESIGVLVVDAKKDAAAVLTIVENNGVPLRAQFADSGSRKILAQWRIQNGNLDQILKDLKEKVGDLTRSKFI